MTKLFEAPDDTDELERLRREMIELERLAQKSPCMMTRDQWDAYESYQEKRDELENE